MGKCYFEPANAPSHCENFVAFEKKCTATERNLDKHRVDWDYVKSEVQGFEGNKNTMRKPSDPRSVWSQKAGPPLLRAASALAGVPDQGLREAGPRLVEAKTPVMRRQ